MEIFQLPMPAWLIIGLIVFFAGIGAAAVHTTAGDNLAKSIDRKERPRVLSDDEEEIRSWQGRDREMREAGERTDHEHQENSPDLEREQLQSTWNS